MLCGALAARAAEPLEAPADAASLESFLDGVVPAQLAAYRLPGATVAVVKEGRWVARGYGDADATRRQPVVADRNLFRVASVGKLLVWTAVMQLAEQGRLELDADVTTSLPDFQVPATFPRPVTLSHLMAHAAGFEVRGRLWPEWTEQAPARVRPPGELSAYSDYGTSLAQRLVERVSGKPFEQYLQESVLGPLGMQRSFFRQSVPPELAADMALGHTFEDGAWQVQPLGAVRVAPGGSLSSTAPDMARFMLAHLQGGRYGEARILRPETVQRMHRQHFTHHPSVSGWAHGFMEFHLGGQRLIGHTGDAYLFHSLLVLLPEQGAGLFVSYDGPGEGEGAPRARMELLEAFLARFFPAPAPAPPAPLPGSQERAARFAGSYQTTWRAYTTEEASVGWRNEVRVSVGPEGTLRLREPGKAVRDWVEVEPRVFQPLGGGASGERVAFREDAQGRITHLFFDNRPTAAYARAPWYETASFTYGLLAVCAALLVSAVVGGPLVRRPLAWQLAALGLLELAALGGFALLLRQGHASWTSPLGVPALLAIPRACALLAAALTVATAAATGLAWWRRSGSLGGRLHLTGVTLAATALAAWLHHWHLLGFGR
jgi:CubicO group peptidase (beta-lactamase class C family)